MLVNEKVLIKMAKKGDVYAFEELIESTQKKAYNLAYRFLRNHHDASEMVQEVYLKVFKSLKGFKEESSFSTWVYKVITNLCIDEIRKKSHKNTYSLDEKLLNKDDELVFIAEERNYSVEKIIKSQEIRRVLNQAIMSLSYEYRVVIILRDIQGFSYKEITKILDSPQGTIKSRLNRARLILREKLGPLKELME